MDGGTGEQDFYTGFKTYWCFANGRWYIAAGGFLKDYCRTIHSSRVPPPPLVVAYSNYPRRTFTLHTQTVSILNVYTPLIPPVLPCGDFMKNGIIVWKNKNTGSALKPVVSARHNLDWYRHVANWKYPLFCGGLRWEICWRNRNTALIILFSFISE